MGILIGPAIVWISMTVLWKNETRFDYYRAASKTTPASSLQDAHSGDSISYSGPMDQSISLEGKYIKSFVGYLVIKRAATIYCWDRDKDSDGHVKWRLSWQSRVETNSRNNGVHQVLQSGEMMPSAFEVDDLSVATDQIEFVDAFESISPMALEKTDAAVNQNLKSESEYLTLEKGANQGLGDERISYRGFKVPATATYFGKFQDGRGVADESGKRTGWVNAMIQDTGILHHLVAGDRETALASLKQYLSRLKWIVRAAGTFTSIFGFWILFGTMARFLYGVPLLGWLAEKGAFLLAVMLGLPLALLTIACGFLFGHLYLLFGLMALVAGIGFVLIKTRKQSKAQQQAFRQSLEQKHGRPLDTNDIKEMEFAELAHLALADSDLSGDESDFLFKWGKKNGFAKSRCQEMLAQARTQHKIPDSDQTTDSHLEQLIKLALADGELTSYEMRTIRSAAHKAGFDNDTVNELMSNLQTAT